MSNAQKAPMDSHDGFGKLLAVGRNLWLAGLGAVAEVEEEGRELFGRLVERGRPLEEKQKKALDSAADRATQTARDFGKLLQDTVEYESRGMLKRLNVMTRDDVKVLAARLTSLSKKIDEYVERRQAAIPAMEVESIAIVTPQGTQLTSKAGKPKASRPRQPKATTR